MMINDDDRYSRDDVAHSMFGTVDSLAKGSDSMSQVHALCRIRPEKSDNKRQSLGKVPRIQNADQSEM